MFRRTVVSISICLLLGACGTSNPPAGDAGPGDAQTLDARADAPSDAAAACDVPSNAAELFPWLRSAAYKGFLAQSAVRAVGSPHGDVRGYVNPTLEASLRAGNAEHPVCAAAVKELYQADQSTLRGWVVWVKLQAGKPGGQGHYWYEVLSTTDGSKPTANAMGVQQCASCHSGGKDYVVMDWPLK